MSDTISPSKVLFMANAFPPIVGGSANVYASLCRELAGDAVAIAPKRTYYDGHEVQGWQEWDSSQPFQVHRLDLLRPQERPSPKTPFHSAWRWWFEDRRIEQEIRVLADRIIRQQQIGVICAGEIYSLSGITQAIGRRAELPVMFYIHGEELTCVPGGHRYQRNARRALQSASALIAVSSFTRDQLVSRYGVDASRVHVIPNGVDLDRFSPGEQPEHLVQRHRLVGKRILLTVGRLVARKGHDTVLRALPNIAQSVSDVAYLVVGDGPEKQRLQGLARDLDISHLVTFISGVATTDLVDYYRLCDVFVMPNRTLPDGDTEGFGLVFLEAGACGKPVIGGNAGGVPDAVGDNDNGLLIDAGSEQEFSAAAVHLLQNRELARRLGQHGLNRSLRSSWEQKARDFRHVCQVAADRARTGASCAT